MNKAKCVLMALAMAVAGCFLHVGTVVAEEGCASILTSIECDESGAAGNGEGIVQLLRLILDIVTAGVGILAVIGIVLASIQYIMSQGDSGKMSAAKNRIFNVVIGLLAYGVMWIVLDWLLPGGILG